MLWGGGAGGGGRAVTGRVRGEVGSPHAHSTPTFPVSFLEGDCDLLLFLSPSNSTGRCLSLV